MNGTRLPIGLAADLGFQGSATPTGTVWHYETALVIAKFGVHVRPSIRLAHADHISPCSELGRPLGRIAEHSLDTEWTQEVPNRRLTTRGDQKYERRSEAISPELKQH